MDLNIKFSEIIKDVKDNPEFKIVPLHLVSTDYVETTKLEDVGDGHIFTTSYAPLKKRQIKIQVTKEQISLIQEYGINIERVIGNALLHEIKHQLSRSICSKIYELANKNLEKHYNFFDKIKSFLYSIVKKEYTKKKKINATDDIVDIIISKLMEIETKTNNRNKGFAVVSPKIASILIEHHNINLNESYDVPSLGIYSVGNIYGVEIYIDPYKKWGDTSIIIGHYLNKDQMFKAIDVSSIKKSPITVSGVEAPTIKITYSQEIVEVDDEVYKNFDQINLKLSKKIKNNEI